LISIRKSVDELSRLDFLEKRHEAILDCYALAIHTTAHYAVEVDPVLAIELRKHLTAIEEQTRAAVSVDQLRSAQSSFRGELREYRDKSNEQLKKMRTEIESAKVAMVVFAEAVASNGTNHEQGVNSQLRSLESTAHSNNIEEIRGGIGLAVAGIQSSMEQIQNENRLLLAQMQDEIRVLHRQIEDERKVLYTDRASGVWNRQKIDTHLDNLLRQNQPFCLLLVSVRNLRRIESQHSPTVVEGALKAMTARFAVIMGDEAMIGRWTDDQFVAVLDLPPGSAIPLAAEATRELSGSYAIQENGQSKRVTLQASAGVIDRPPGADAPTFHQKLQQLAAAISGA
jgi:GGDEF domain-containing protein